MGIVQYPTPIPVTVGGLPNLKFMTTTDNLATVTTAGYLNSGNLDAANPISKTDIIMALYNYSLQTTSGTFAIFTVNISGASGSITLTQWADTANVVLPTTAGAIAYFTNATGTISAAPNTVFASGSIEAGESGIAGTLVSFPSAANKGSLILAAVANTGNTNTTISNAAMGQASVVTIPDPGTATANFIVAPAALVSGNLLQASGTAGLVVDSTIATTNLMKVNTTNTLTSSGRIIANKVNGTEAANAVTASGMAGVITTSSLSTAGGASYSITWTNTFITTTSVILFSITDGTNTTENFTLTIAPGAGTATLKIYNNTAATALNGTILINYLVI